MKPPVRAHTRQAPSNSSNNKMSKNTDIKFMWSFCSDEGYSIQRTPLWQYNFHFYSPTCSLSINMLRFIGQIYNYARLKSYIKAKCCVFFLLLLHTQSSVFSKCVHSENKSSRAAMSYISEPIGWQPVLRCGEGYSEWRRGERKWSKQKWKKRGVREQLCDRNLHTHAPTTAHTHRCTSDRVCAGGSWTQRCALVQPPPGVSPGTRPPLCLSLLASFCDHTGTKSPWHN